MEQFVLNILQLTLSVYLSSTRLLPTTTQESFVSHMGNRRRRRPLLQYDDKSREIFSISEVCALQVRTISKLERNFVLCLCRVVNNDIERPSFFFYLSQPPSPKKTCSSILCKRRSTKKNKNKNKTATLLHQRIILVFDDG